jgi:hypothetical protein
VAPRQPDQPIRSQLSTPPIDPWKDQAQAPPPPGPKVPLPDERTMITPEERQGYIARLQEIASNRGTGASRLTRWRDRS